MLIVADIWEDAKNLIGAMIDPIIDLLNKGVELGESAIIK